MIKIGTAGTPRSAKERTSFSGIERVHELGLDAMEIEFTYGVRMGKGTARELREHNKQYGVTLSIHGPYYINLNSLEKQKVRDSEKRILKSCEIGDLIGVRDIVYHPGFYMKMDPETAYANVYNETIALVEEVEKNSWNVRLCPETTGKPTQFGSWEELTRMCKDIPGLGMTVDFSHVWARAVGDISYDDVLREMKKELGSGFLSDLHMHFSGIEYTTKGERRHLNLLDGAEPGFDRLVGAMKKWKLGGTAICESPNIEEDALKMKELLQ